MKETKTLKVTPTEATSIYKEKEESKGISKRHLSDGNLLPRKDSFGEQLTPRRNWKRVIALLEFFVRLN